MPRLCADEAVEKNEYGTGSVWYCEGRKELAHTIVRLQLILFSEETGAF